MNEHPSPSPVPVTLAMLSLVAFFSWQLWGGLSTRAALARVQDNSDAVVDQSAQIKDNVRKLLDDLLTLSEKNAAAKQVVTKYGIRRAGPSAGNATDTRP